MKRQWCLSLGCIQEHSWHILSSISVETGQLKINFLPNCGIKYHFERPGNGMQYRNTQETEIIVATLGMRKILPGGSVFWADSSGQSIKLPGKGSPIFIFSSDLCPVI